jgi:hypothetical protein
MTWLQFASIEHHCCRCCAYCSSFRTTHHTWRWGCSHQRALQPPQMQDAAASRSLSISTPSGSMHSRATRLLRAPKRSKLWRWQLQTKQSQSSTSQICRMLMVRQRAMVRQTERLLLVRKPWRQMARPPRPNGSVAGARHVRKKHGGRPKLPCVLSLTPARAARKRLRGRHKTLLQHPQAGNHRR